MERGPMSRGRQKFACQKRHWFLLGPRCMNSCRRANGNHILSTRVSSNLPTFLGGTQVNPFYLTNVPPILASKFFPPPGQQDKLLPSRFEFFHGFPPRGEGLGWGGRFHRRWNPVALNKKSFSDIQGFGIHKLYNQSFATIGVRLLPNDSKSQFPMHNQSFRCFGDIPTGNSGQRV